MGQGVKRTQRDYSLTFKLAVVEQIEKGELTCCVFPRMAIAQ